MTTPTTTRTTTTPADPRAQRRAVEQAMTGWATTWQPGKPLTSRDVQALSGVIGQRPAAQLAKQLGREAKRGPKRPRRTFWQWFFGAPHEAPAPLPDSVASAVLRIQSGEPISRNEINRLAKHIGRKAAGDLEKSIRKATRNGRAVRNRRR